jgi:hypothetical protein
MLTEGWEWICRWCGHMNRGTDSSHFCEKMWKPKSTTRYSMKSAAAWTGQ